MRRNPGRYGREPRGDVGEPERPAVQHRGAHHEPHGERGEDQRQPPQLALADPLAVRPDVGGGDAHDAGLAQRAQGRGVGLGHLAVWSSGGGGPGGGGPGVYVVRGSEVCWR